jgi:hypothetical protein
VYFGVSPDVDKGWSLPLSLDYGVAGTFACLGRQYREDVGGDL